MSRRNSGKMVAGAIILLPFCPSSSPINNAQISGHIRSTSGDSGKAMGQKVELLQGA